MTRDSAGGTTDAHLRRLNCYRKSGKLSTKVDEKSAGYLENPQKFRFSEFSRNQTSFRAIKAADEA
jgi:hypothetical protein